MLSAMSEDNECSVFIFPSQKRALILGIFSAYYHPQVEKEVIFDANPWIMDSIELLIRRNAFDVSRLFI